MQVRVITMRYNEGLQGFSEDQLQKATFGKSVLNVSEHFFVHGNVPHLALVLQVGDAPRYENAVSYRPRDPNVPDPMEDMTDAQKSVFLALKTWRNETAKAEGRPAYAIARNTQLAALVTEGVPFLGLRIWGGAWRLQRGRFLRTRRTFAERCRQFAAGRLDEARFAQCCASSDGASRWFGFKGILNGVASDDLASGEGSSSGSNRVKRGGSWNNNASNCTSSNRNNNNPSNSNNNNGFRLSSTLVKEKRLSRTEGSHPVGPAFRECGNEHAPTRRLVARANAARV